LVVWLTVTVLADLKSFSGTPGTPVPGTYRCGPLTVVPPCAGLGAGLRVFVGLGVGDGDLAGLGAPVGVGDVLGEEVGDGVVCVGVAVAVGLGVSVAVGAGLGVAVGVAVLVELAVGDGLVQPGLGVVRPLADAAPGRATMAARPAARAMAVSRLIRHSLQYFRLI
jgi:hypothetical protein